MTDDQVLDWIKSKMTARGGFTAKSMREMGINGKPPRNWIRQVIFLARQWTGVGNPPWEIRAKDKSHIAESDGFIIFLHKKLTEFQKSCHKTRNPFARENSSHNKSWRKSKKISKREKKHRKKLKQQKKWEELKDYTTIPEFIPNGHRRDRKSYEAYLNSKHWKTRRKLMLSITSGKCAKSGEVAAHVHHLTYANLFNERPSDLMPLCETWHKAVHEDNGKNALEKSRNVLGEEFVDQWIDRLNGVTWSDLLQT